jgi:CRISPR/Cas system-associated exonuclease Cas4 (RecB family)
VLDPHFRFSQHSLSDFADCPRRFYLRHVARQAWPLLVSGPHGMDAQTYQGYLQRGALLHRWIERYWSGIPTSNLELGTQHAELGLWWSRFQATDFSGLPVQRFPELELSAPLGDYRVYARFDLLALHPHANLLSEGDSVGAVIVDWKTLRGDTPPSHEFLKRRLQTRVYLYVLATAGAPFNGGQPIPPEACAMRYWLANFPERPWVEIRYSRAEYVQDAALLNALAANIKSRSGQDQFPKTDDVRHCTYCTYRTLCHQHSVQDAAVPDEEVSQSIDIGAGEALDY